jgi:hypothetical protein
LGEHRICFGFLNLSLIHSKIQVIN